MSGLITPFPGPKCLGEIFSSGAVGSGSRCTEGEAAMGTAEAPDGSASGEHVYGTCVNVLYTAEQAPFN